MKDEANCRHLIRYNEIFKKNNDIYSDFIRKTGMSECAFWILYSIKTAPQGITQKEICEMMYEPKQTVNSAIKKLCEEEYLYLERVENTRSKNVHLTKKGKEIADKTALIMINSEIEAFERMGEDGEEFLRLYDKYTELLKTVCNEKI